MNLQIADTVVNLELPWNPAVLEQRIARPPHGAGRPAVVNLVTRDTIEENVLRTLESKKGLFAGVFESDSAELPFEAIKTSRFIDSMRDLVTESEVRSQESGDRRQKSGADSSTAQLPESSSATIWQGIAQLLEAACAMLCDPAVLAQLPPETREKLRKTAIGIASRLARDSSPN